MAANISTYLEGIAASLTTSNTFLEGNEYDFNLDVRRVSTFPVIHFFNLGTETIQQTEYGGLRWIETPLIITFATKNDLDIKGDEYAAIHTTMKEVGNDFMIKIRQSDEFKNTNEQILPPYSFDKFVDRTDTKLIGVVLTTTIRLKLSGYDCTGT